MICRSSPAFAPLLFIHCLAVPVLAEAPVEAVPIRFVTGTTFRKVVEQPISATWDNVNLRTIVRAIEEAKRVAILCDRRVDPTAELRVSASEEPLGDFLERLAAGSQAGGTILGNTVYLGPRSMAARLRTLAALSKQEPSSTRLWGPQRAGEMNYDCREGTFGWNDLERPEDILARLAEQYSLDVEGLELILHDLWGGAVLPDATPVEALSLVLIQFDLTFAWTDHGRGIRLEKIPDRVVIEQGHPAPRGMSANAALANWQEKIPDLEGTVEAGKIVIKGTVEVHEMIDRLRHGGSLPEKKAVATREGPPLKPLKFERYTLKMRNTPARALLKELGTPARGLLTFEYDDAEFKAAEINLDKLLSFDVTNATIEELLKATFEPLGVTFELVDRTVKLKSASRK